MQQQPKTGDTSLFQIFERINSSGRSLLPQEIRNCVYQGPINSLLFELNNNNKWRKLWGSERRDDRMRDLEFILRFFALSDHYIQHSDNPPSRISLKKYLNQFMELANNESKISDFRHRFNSTIDYIFDNFGLSAFHNYQKEQGKWIPAFSPTIYDSIMISTDEALRRGIKLPTPEDAKEAKKLLLENQEYQNLLYQETMRTPNIKARVSLMFEAVFHEDW